MKKLTFSMRNVVRININFKEVENKKLVVEFHKFLAANSINYTPGVANSLDFHVGYYTTADAVEVEKWLINQDAELENSSLLPLLIRIKDVVIGLKMFLENVDANQLEKIASQVMQETKPEHRELLLSKMSVVYGYSPAVREFASSFVKKLLEESKKGKLILKNNFKKEELMLIRVEDIFSTKTSNCLISKEIETISELVDLLKKDGFNLLKIRNFGKISLCEVNAFLSLYNL